MHENELQMLKTLWTFRNYQCQFRHGVQDTSTHIWWIGIEKLFLKCHLIDWQYNYILVKVSNLKLEYHIHIT